MPQILTAQSNESWISPGVFSYWSVFVGDFFSKFHSLVKSKPIERRRRIGRSPLGPSGNRSLTRERRVKLDQPPSRRDASLKIRDIVKSVPATYRVIRRRAPWRWLMCPEMPSFTRDVGASPSSTVIAAGITVPHRLFN